MAATPALLPHYVLRQELLHCSFDLSAAADAVTATMQVLSPDTAFLECLNCRHCRQRSCLRSRTTS